MNARKFVEDNQFATAPVAAEPSNKANDNGFNETYIDGAKLKHLNEELSDAQREAVNETEQNVLLIAPAGTGKTRVMTTRLLNLIAQGVKPGRIVACTFTNAAAAEIVERVEPLLKVPASDLWIGTAHSIGLRIIRQDHQKLGLVNVDYILDPQQTFEIIQTQMQATGHTMADSPHQATTAKRIIEFIEAAKNKMMSVEEVKSAIEGRRQGWLGGIDLEDWKVFEAYENYKRMYDMIDYNDMIYMPTQLIENNAERRAYWQDQFDHIMVDEYQDMANAQIRFLRNLVNTKRTNFYAAADDDQSIYGWRGSDLRATLEFERMWPNAKLVHLTDNYRTPMEIFQKSSKLISNNRHRHEKRVFTASDPNALVRAIEAYDPNEEKQRILDTIIEAKRVYETPYEEIAILTRTNRQANEFAGYLAANNVPVNLHETLQLGAEPIRALISWMQLSTKADNPLMFARIARYPETYVDDGKLLEFEMRTQRAKEKGKENRGPIGYLESMRSNGRLPAETGAGKLLAKIDQVREMLKHVDGDDSENKITNPFGHVATTLGILARANQSDRPEDHQITGFIRLADEMVQNIGLERTLASLNSLDLNAGREGVNITTMHGAKGLEFDIVVLPGWDASSFPSSTWGENIEEERRLAYVATTRARKLLVVSWSANRKGGTNKPSMFVKEMGLIDG